MLSLKSEIQLLFVHTSWPVLSFEIGNVKQDWPPVSNCSYSFANWIHVKCEYVTPLAYILHVCTIYNPILVKCVHVTTLHIGVPFMGRQQIEAPWTFNMALAYVCDISSLLCNTVCVQVNLLCATYCILSSMVFHSTIKLSKYVSL